MAGNITLKTQAKNLATRKIESEPYTQFVRDTGANTYGQQKSDFMNLYNRQSEESKWWAQQSDSIKTNNQRRQDEQRAADRNAQSIEADKNRAQAMSLSRQQQFGDARTSALFSVSNTTFDPDSTLQMRSQRAAAEAAKHRSAQEYGQQAALADKQNAYSMAQMRMSQAFQAGENDKNRAASMYQSMWNSVSSPGQYNYRYW